MAKNGVGTSAHTNRKHELRGDVVRAWFSIASRSARWARLQIIDCSLGIGEGMLVYLHEIQQLGGLDRVTFIGIERHRGRCEIARDRLAGWPVRVIHEDSAVVLPDLPIPRSSLTLFDWDPNSADIEPVHAIAAYPGKKDVFMHLTAGAPKRARLHHKARYDEVVQALGFIHVMHWWDRISDHTTGYQHVIVVATDYEPFLTKIRNAKRYTSRDSDIGRWETYLLSTTKNERQGELFGEDY
jgi:hypothetical protein